ncbi:MAG: phosphoribosylglycinamide formyltransferase [Clostridiales bacterium GWF2_36_10]|nr:MAG: phosphoribosylglycinamide formyltransferase [Clostridiales bacterium GWF2_36_10]HAN21151.1 phosphoribosylglycinamide formyltransferase [Clostridiales bacterium]
MLKVNIAVLVSGSGTNLQALINACKAGIIKSGEIKSVISSKEGVYALERANQNGIKNFCVPKKEFPVQKEFENKLIEILKLERTDLIVLAGFMCVLSADFVNEYKDRIINVHPSLIPSFCGDGFYGLRVHKAALDYGVKISGATVHYVNEVTDGGKIILQKAINIKKSDTPEILQKRIMEQAEWKILPRACEMVCKSLIKEKKNG